MNTKTLSIVSYLTIIGWLIAYFNGKDHADDYLKYHLRQGFGLFVFGILLSLALNIVIFITGLWILGYLGLITLILMILGMINASNNVKKPLPIIGGYFEKQFAFIG